MACTSTHTPQQHKICENLPVVGAAVGVFVPTKVHSVSRKKVLCVMCIRSFASKFCHQNWVKGLIDTFNQNMILKFLDFNFWSKCQISQLSWPHYKNSPRDVISERSKAFQGANIWKEYNLRLLQLAKKFFFSTLQVSFLVARLSSSREIFKTPQKRFHMANFHRMVRSLLDFRLAAKYTKCKSKVRKYGPEMWESTSKWRVDPSYDVRHAKTLNTFGIPIFGSKSQISQPYRWYPDQK